MSRPQSRLASSPANSIPSSPQMTGTEPESSRLSSRQKLLLGLQRISSTPSLAKVGRTRSSDKVYRPAHKASISCVSLGSSPQGTSISPPITAQPRSTYATPPATPNSSGTQSPLFFPFPSASAIDLRTTRTTLHEIPEKPIPRRDNFNFWKDLPQEIRIHIFGYLMPQEIIRLSVISKSWYQMCFDGQLWTNLDCQTYYQKITSDALIKIMLRAGAFVKNLNLRGCVQLRDQWLSLGTRMTNQECRNLESFSIEGCKIERSSIHFFLYRNPKLLHINMPSLQQINNTTLKIIAAHCPQIELLNIDWCSQVDAKGLTRVVQCCGNLSDLRASEVRGLDDNEFALELFKRNGLERLFLQHCDSLTDEALVCMMHGKDPARDLLTERFLVAPRRLRHLDISECAQLTDLGLRSLIHNVPFLEGLRLCKNHALTDASLIDLVPTTPRLSHLELDELDQITNAALIALSKAPCARALEHLSISYCDQIGDVGVLPVLKSCPELRSLCCDNTRISDLTLMEASEQIRKRGSLTRKGARPTRGLELIAFDCSNVTWAGVREVLQGNCRVLQGRKKSVVSTTQADDHDESETDYASPSHELKRVIEIQTLLFPAQIIHLKAFYGWQQTVEAHYKRCMQARWSAASRLEHKWAEWMVATEEVGIMGGGGSGWGSRRRRRRAREAESRVREDEQGMAVEEVHGTGTGTETEDMSNLSGPDGRRPVTRRRRARSGGCSVM